MRSERDRWADDNYRPAGGSAHEFEVYVRSSSRGSARPQRIHDHQEGHLCTNACGVLTNNGHQEAASG